MASALPPSIPESSAILGPDSQGGHRTRRLLQGTVATFLSKGLVLLVNAISIPIAIRYLGATEFGIWTTISTSLAMLLVLDFGVANSLTNFLSEAYALKDRASASTYATTALAVMVLLALLLALVAWILWPYIGWAGIFHLPSDELLPTVRQSVAAALIVFLIGLPASLAPKILGGYQELRTANIFSAIGSLLNLAVVIVLVKMHASLAALVAGSAAAQVGANVVCLFWIFFLHKPWLLPRFGHLNRKAAVRMSQMGGEFFILQIAGLVVFNSDNLVVAHYLGPQEVAPYSVAWRLVGYAAIAQTILAPSLWPAFSEAFVRNDYTWVRNIFWHTMRITMGAALAFALLFAVAGRWIIRIWASSAAVPTQGLMLLMCAWILISTFMNNTATVLVAKGETKLQAWCSLGAAAMNLWLSIYFVQRCGAIGVIGATIISYVLILIVPQSVIAWRVLHGDAV